MDYTTLKALCAVKAGFSVFVTIASSIMMKKNVWVSFHQLILWIITCFESEVQTDASHFIIQKG